MIHLDAGRTESRIFCPDSKISINSKSVVVTRTTEKKKEKRKGVAKMGSPLLGRTWSFSVVTVISFFEFVAGQVSHTFFVCLFVCLFFNRRLKKIYEFPVIVQFSCFFR